MCAHCAVAAAREARTRHELPPPRGPADWYTAGCDVGDGCLSCDAAPGPEGGYFCADICNSDSCELEGSFASNLPRGECMKKMCEYLGEVFSTYFAFV